MRGLLFSLARVTIEAITPLTIGRGDGDDLLDALFVVDANGLPTLPGSSLAGVLRHAVAQGKDPHDPMSRSARWFGYQVKEQGAHSRVDISWAQVHDENNRPVPFRGRDVQGPILEKLAAGITRDHVCISERGVVDGRGKFDETLIPIGTRFSFEITIHAGEAKEDSHDIIMKHLLGLLQGGLRIGGRTRHGFGAIKLVQAHSRTFDLRKADERRLLAQLPVALDAPLPDKILQPVTVKSILPDNMMEVTLRLNPQDYWMFGGGENGQKLGHFDERTARVKNEKGEFKEEKTKSALHILPWTESIIVWQNNRAELKQGADEPYILVASGLKGALRHRVLFHHRRLNKQWVNELSSTRFAKHDTASEDLAIQELFGHANTSLGQNEGQSGRVFLSDVVLSAQKIGRLQHVSLDRFTGGPMDGMLFSEAPLFEGPTVVIKMLIAKHQAISSKARQALYAALNDLCKGQLALGAGSARGHGYFTGSIECNDVKWLKGDT